MKRGFSPLRDVPVLLWLAALVLVTLVHPFIPASRWLMIHLLLLGAISHAIVVWSRHFAKALLRAGPRPGEERAHRILLLLLNGGVVLVIAGMLAGFWPLVAAGATAVGSAVIWHGGMLVAELRRALPARFAITVRYYVAAACCLPIGAVFGMLLARDLAGSLHDRLMMAHASINLLGWMGLTVIGTLVMLWPAMLRTRIAAGTEHTVRRALPVLLTAVAGAATGAALGIRWLAVAGFAGYLVGVGIAARSWLAAARGKPPASFAPWSVLASLGWLTGCLVTLTVTVAFARDWADAYDWFRWLTPLFAAGFGAQVLVGALSFLVPAALGGGAGPVRAGNAVFDRAAELRLVVANSGILICALPVPSVVRVVASILVLAALAAFLPLLGFAIRAQRRAQRAARKAAAVGDRSATPESSADESANTSGGYRPYHAHSPIVSEEPPSRPRTRSPAALAATGLAVMALAVATGVAIDPSATGFLDASGGVEPTGETTTVRVTAKQMRFTPSRIEVPAGNRLVIEVVNADPENVHDLVLDSGERTGRLGPGDSERLDVDVVGRDIAGWCSVVGHRQMGMTLSITAVGGAGGGSHDHGGSGATAASDTLDLQRKPGSDFTPRDATLPPAPSGQVHRHTFRVREVEREVAPGVTQRLWTFNGTAPGPVLRGRVGDVFEITLVNDASIGHSIDFHASALAPDRPMRTIAPGKSLTYRFTATRAGVWMYHCGTAPVSAHIANGLYGAVIIDPPGLPQVDREYVIVQSEFYLGKPGGTVDVDKLHAEQPDLVVFNGHANQYRHFPLTAKVGESVRIWVLNAGPNRTTSFHVIGAQFHTVYAEGAYRLRPGDQGGSQSLGLTPAQGGFVELSFPEAGHYPFVSHVMVDHERGAGGIFAVTEG